MCCSSRLLMADRAADYQICGTAAFHRYGWDAQVPQRLDVYNTAASGIRQIGAATFCLIQVTPERLGDTEVVPTPNGVDAIYSSRARSLVDAGRSDPSWHARTRTDGRRQ